MAAHFVSVVAVYSGAGIRHPERKAVGVSLVACNGLKRSSPGSRFGSRCATRGTAGRSVFQIVAPAARGNFDQNVWMPSPQFVPIGEMSLDVEIFCNSLPIWRVVAPPVPERIDVEIFAVQINALLRDEAVDVFDEPFSGFGIAQVQQPAFLSAKDPLGMILRQPCILCDALGLEPEDEISCPLRGHGLKPP